MIYFSIFITKAVLKEELLLNKTFYKYAIHYTSISNVLCLQYCCYYYYSTHIIRYNRIITTAILCYCKFKLCTSTINIVHLNAVTVTFGLWKNLEIVIAN